jgi:hypothetical protein
MIEPQWKICTYMEEKCTTAIQLHVRPVSQYTRVPAMSIESDNTSEWIVSPEFAFSDFASLCDQSKVPPVPSSSISVGSFNQQQVLLEERLLACIYMSMSRMRKFYYWCKMPNLRPFCLGGEHLPSTFQEGTNKAPIVRVPCQNYS